MAANSKVFDDLARFQGWDGLIDLRVRDWLLAGVRRNICLSVGTYGKSERRDRDVGRYSSRCTWHKTEHTARCHACFRIIGRRFYISVDLLAVDRPSRHQWVLTLPVGWRWRGDDTPCVQCVNRPELHFHPGGAAFLESEHRPSLPLQWVQQAIANYRLRRRLAKEAAAFDADFQRLLPLLGVTIRDSVLAGNCPVGSRAFADREGFAGKDVMPATICVARGGDAGRLAALAAFRRLTLVSI